MAAFHLLDGLGLPHVSPMMATLRHEIPRDDERWAYEMKWDGVRAMVYVDDDQVRALSRNDLDVTPRYPELVQMAATVDGRSMIIDGEVVAFDESGAPDFARLQPRMHVVGAAKVESLRLSTPVTFLAFDLVHLDGEMLINASYTERRAALESLALNGPRWQTPPSWSGDGALVLEAAADQGLEGVVAKLRTSPYLAGRRSDQWLKIKNLRTQEVVIGGWQPGEGRRIGVLGSLLVGIPDGDRLAYAGKVGTGFTDSMLDDLTRDLRTRETAVSPFDVVPAIDSRNARWVRPELVGEVRFGNWTPDDRLRHPAWRGLRPDKAPDEVVREP